MTAWLLGAAGWGVLLFVCAIGLARVGGPGKAKE